MREHREDGALVQAAGRDLRVEVAVRPVDDDLVGLGKATGRGEDGPRIAHRHVIAEEAATLATAAAKSIAPKTSIRGFGAKPQTKTRIPSPRRSPSGP